MNLEELFTSKKSKIELELIEYLNRYSGFLIKTEANAITYKDSFYLESEKYLKENQIINKDILYNYELINLLFERLKNENKDITSFLNAVLKVNDAKFKLVLAAL